jgi:hypothetical protein
MGTADWTKARLYQWHAIERVWKAMAPAQNLSHYMDVLETITENAADGIFSNVFCRVLFAQQAAINTLASKVITLLEGGSIKSQNYMPGVNGFSIDYDGNAEFNNINIINKAFFSGDIVSGPLELNNRNSASPIEIKTWGQNDFTQEFFDYVSGKDNLDRIVPTNGIYGDVAFSFYGVYQATKQTWYCRIYDKDMRSLFGVNGGGFIVKNPNYSPPSQYAPKFEYGSFKIGFYNPDGKTFKLYNLPLNEPNYTGAIWQDSAGYLRIKK